MKYWVFLVPLFAGSAMAQSEYEGLYRPNAEWAENWDCKTLGQDGGALAVIDNQFLGVERACRLTNPVNVRDMAATLYDAECTAEGMTSNERMMLLDLPDGLAVLTDGNVNILRHCS